jgi:hypothetical protein
MDENEPITYEGVIDRNIYTIFQDDSGGIVKVIVETDSNIVVLDFEDLNAAISKAYII